MARLLVVEDDDTISRALESTLVTRGHDVVVVDTGRAALRASAASSFDLVLLDLGLPDIDGVTVCQRMRRDPPAPLIVILTARDDEIDIVTGLEAGADDYLTKPIGLAELHARLAAHLRRAGDAGETPPIVLGDLVVDLAGRTLRVGEGAVPIRAREFELLVRLAQQPGVAVSRETLMADVWGVRWQASTKTLDVHMATLRRRIAEAAGRSGAAMPQIVTLRRHGYRLDLPTTPEA